nr:MAG TPA: hypothetical protein [Caudoviricetes sp.]
MTAIFQKRKIEFELKIEIGLLINEPCKFLSIKTLRLKTDKK